MSYEERTYRSLINKERFSYFSAIYLETDLFIGSSRHEQIEVMQTASVWEIKRLRSELDTFIYAHPGFKKSFIPLSYEGTYPKSIEQLINAGSLAGTGPMAGIAGLFAHVTGQLLREQFSLKEIVVENGGDIFAAVEVPLKISIYAGDSVLSKKLNISLEPGDWGVCTSSGTVGHSKSFGKADALTVIARSPVVADALATSLANRIQRQEDIEKVLDYSQQFKEIKGIVIIVGDKVGIRGDIEVGPGA